MRASNGKFIDEHRVVLGLEDAGFNVVVHHKDGNPRNNDPDNLEFMSRDEHHKLHGFGTKIRPPNQELFDFDKDGLAVCRMCGNRKHKSEFNKDSRYKCGYRSACLNCRNAMKAWYKHKGGQKPKLI